MISLSEIHATAERIDLGRLLDAIAQVESGGNDQAVGAHGERGRYQIREETWRAIAPNYPFIFAHDPAISRKVAMRHLEWLAQRVACREPACANIIAIAWNAGVHAATDGYATPEQKDYAQRVTNIYQSTP